MMSGVTEYPLQMPAQLSDPVLIFFVIIGVASLASNSFLICLLCKDTQRGPWRGCNFFLLQNSITDLLFTVVCVPFWILASTNDKKQLVNKTFCETSAAISFIHLIAPGIFLMQAVAYRHCWLTDREQAEKTFSVTRSRLVVLLSWVLIIPVCLSSTFGWSDRPGLNCAPDLVTHAWYTATVLLLFIAFPQSVSLYVVIYDMCSLRQKSKKHCGRLTSDSDTRPKSLFESQRSGLQAEHLTSYKALFLVIFIHALFWLPYIFISLVEMLSSGKIYHLDNEQGIPTAFIALAVSLTSAPLKGIVYCSEEPNTRHRLKEQFSRKSSVGEHGSSADAENEEA